MHEVVYLEKSLLTLSTRTSIEQLQLLLCEDFIEFSSSGKVYNKEDILKSLPNEDERNLEMYSVSCKKLSDDSIFITYKLFENCTLHSLRSSIWIYNHSMKGWQMIFHQGTLCC